LGRCYINISVVGLGKLGLPLAALLAKAGHKVSAYDRSSALISRLTNAEFHSSEPNLMGLLTESKVNLNFTDKSEEAFQGTDAVFIIVPTPSEKDGQFSNDYIIEFISKLKPKSFENKKIVFNIVSTVMPGSTDGIIKTTLEVALNTKVGDTLGLCYNPEFIALGSVVKDMQEPDMHLLGQSSDWAGDIIEEILNSIVLKPVPCRRMNLTEAELVKIAVNNFVTMKISFANILFQAAVKLGNVNIDTVTESLGLDSRIGSKYLKGSVPYGGPCFPRDTRALTALFTRIGVEADLSIATELVNDNHVKFIINQLQSNFNGAKVIGIIGASYKSGTSVIEESAGISIAKELLAKNFKVIIWDDEDITLPLDITNEVLKEDSFSSLVAKSDYVVISRPFNNINEIHSHLKEQSIPFTDLWRQIK
jgi:UDPglucose 6-dehydrogenase